MALHKDLTGTDLHEPKGVAAASVNTFYGANGSGSGSWRKVVLADLDSTSILSPNTYFLTGVISDVSTASSVLIPIPVNSTLVSARIFLGGAITGADAMVSFVRNDGSSFGSNVTVAMTGSAEGTSFPFTATLNQVVTAPGYVKVSTDGASTNTVPLYIVITLTATP